MDKIKKLIQVSNYVIEVKTSSKKEPVMVIRDVARTWSINFSSESPMFIYYMSMADSAKENESLKTMMTSSIMLMYILTTFGVFDDKAIGELLDVVKGINVRFAEAYLKLSDPEEDRKDGEDWLKRQTAMSQMADEYVEEKKEG